MRKRRNSLSDAPGQLIFDFDSGARYFTTHNEQYAWFQQRWQETRNQKYLGELYSIALQITARYTRQYSRYTHYVADADAKIEDMATWLIELYLKHENFTVKNISSYAHYAEVAVLHNKKTVRYEQFQKDIEKLNRNACISVEEMDE